MKCIKHLSFSLIFVFGASIVANGQDTSEVGGAATSQLVDENVAKLPFLDNILDIIVHEPLSALIASIVAIFIVPILQNIAHRSRVSKIFSGVKIKKGHRKNSIMMLGLGGAGKTTLSRRICGDMKKDPSEQTEIFKLFEGNGVSNGNKFDYYVSDYRGQNVGSLIKGFVQQQLVERSPFRFNDVNTLILVVDIIAPDPALENKSASEHPKVKSVETDRIQENISQWNRTALDAIFGMHTINSLRYVCLFVNKKDRLESWNLETEKKITNAYASLAADLERRCYFEDENLGKQQYAVFDMLIGSAAGEVPIQLLDRLQSLSVPLNEDFGVLAKRNKGHGAKAI